MHKSHDVTSDDDDPLSTLIPINPLPGVEADVLQEVWFACWRADSRCNLTVAG